MSLIQKLPDGPLDIVGDIHGEYDALYALLRHLGYDEHGRHAQSRTLVFVGDFCDRGPDSPAVLSLVQRLIGSGRAVAVLGNHEINLMSDDPKDGSGWFFEQRAHRDSDKYAPFARIAPAQRQAVLALLDSLPIALEREDLRVVHAAWLDAPIATVRQLPVGSVHAAYSEWEKRTHEHSHEANLTQRMQQEQQAWGHNLEDPRHQPPFLPAHAEHELVKQMLNPLKVLTSGVERQGAAAFFAGGKWRFVQRVAWWDEYDAPIPVVVGHYWRRFHTTGQAVTAKEEADLFASVHPLHWHGKQGNVFCVDFSVGGRWQERKAGHGQRNHYRLAALRWPERVLQFDDGSLLETQGFAEIPHSLPE